VPLAAGNLDVREID